LLTIGRPAVPALVRALDSDDPRVRERIIGLLGDFGEQARAAAPALRRLLRDPSLDLYAAYHLWRIEPGAAETLTVLRAALAHDHLYRRRDAAKYIRVTGRAAACAMAELVREVEGQDVWTSTYAAEGLARIGPKAECAAPAAVRALKAD